ncbi:hypothetical protein ACFV1U_32410 [Streptomyces microflavus]
MQGADPPEGYREAIAAHRATWNATRQHTSPEIQAAAERQLRERFREPEEHFADGRQALAELRAKAADEQQVRPSDASRARALQRLATEHAGLATLMPTAAPRSSYAEQARSGAEASTMLTSPYGAIKGLHPSPAHLRSRREQHYWSLAP